MNGLNAVYGMDPNHEQYLQYLKEVFSSNFDPEVIKAVLVQSNWNVDKAVDDLMSMMSTCSVPVESDLADIPRLDYPTWQSSSKSDIPRLDYPTWQSSTKSDIPRLDYPTWQSSSKSDIPRLDYPTWQSSSKSDIPRLDYPTWQSSSKSNLSETNKCDPEIENENDDDLIVIDEEEYSLPIDSDSDSEVEEIPTDELDKSETKYSENDIKQAFPYAAAAQNLAEKPAPDKVVIQKPPSMIYSSYTSFDRIKRTRDSIERVKLFVQHGFKIMVILRGCSGSGKSTLAKAILEECGTTHNELHYIHSTDNYFYLNRHGTYVFDRDKLEEAHKWNQVNVLHVVKEGLTPVIIDNTNSEISDMQPYVYMAACAGYEMEVVEPDNHWVFHAPTLVKKSKHSVPEDVIRRMLKRYEHKVSASVLLKAFNLDYSSSNVSPIEGVRILKNPELIHVFDSIRYTVSVVPYMEPKQESREKKQNAKKEKKLRKRQKKESRKLKKLQEKGKKKEEEMAKGCVEIDLLTETDSADSVVDLHDSNPILPEVLEDLEVETVSDGDEEAGSADYETISESLCEEESSEVADEATSATEGEEVESNSENTPTTLKNGEMKESDEEKEEAIDNVLVVEDWEELEEESSITLSNQLRDVPNTRLSCFKNIQEKSDQKNSMKIQNNDNRTENKPSTSIKFEYTDQAVNTNSLHENCQNRESIGGSSLSSIRNGLPSSKVSVSEYDTVENYETLVPHDKSFEKILKVRNSEPQPAAGNLFSSNNTIQNVIANDLWGKSDGAEIDDGFGREDVIDKNLSDDSENSDSKSNSSSSEKVVITDVHNTLNRFVNNDIKSDQTTERKTPNKSRDKNENIRYSNETIRIPMNRDKVINQSEISERQSEVGEVPSTFSQNDDKKSNIPGFQVIENQLKEGNEEAGVVEESTDMENRFLNQWMKGDGWEDFKDTDDKRNDIECKLQRVRESSSKQKNTETASIRLVNDIGSTSSSPKTTSLLDKNTNQELAQSIKPTSFSRSSCLLNTMSKTLSKEESIESDFESKFRAYRYHFDNDVWSSEFCENASSPWNTTDSLKNVKPSSPRNMKNINVSSALLQESPRSENSEDSRSTQKRSLIGETSMNRSIRTEKIKASDLTDTKSNNYFLPIDILNLERNKWTNTGIDDPSVQVVHKIARCREINLGRNSCDVTTIKQSYKCDKSTMTEGRFYTVKAKPKREDLVNLFPADKVDIILDLYGKCKGNMDWILELLMEDTDAFSPNEAQLEYFASLQNVVELYENVKPLLYSDEDDKETKSPPKKRNRPCKKKRQNNGSGMDTNKKNKHETFLADASSPNEDSSGSSSETVSEELIELFLDWSTVSQLMQTFGNPTIYTVQDYQPIVKLPGSLAHQLHAYLIGSMIDQVEENEDFINQLVEEEQNMANGIRGAETMELSQKDVNEMENNVGSILNDPFYMPVYENSASGEIPSEIKRNNRNENSFSSKLSLNLLLRAFPTLDTTFVKNTFKSQNFNYYDTKNVLNQYKKEVPVNGPSDSPSNESYYFEYEDNVQLIENEPTNKVSSFEVVEQVNEYRMDAAANQRESQKYRDSMKLAVQEKKFGVAAYYRDIMEAYKEKCAQNNAQAAAVLVNSSCIENNLMIDLHYFKVVDAITALDKFLDHHILKLIGSGRTRTILYIVTGRGARSKDGISRLQPPVKTRLKRRNISFEIEPCNIGLVKATIKKNSLMSTDLEVNR